MNEGFDVKALRARFNNQDTSSRDSDSPKSPRPRFGKAAITETDLTSPQRLFPNEPFVPGLGRFPKPESPSSFKPAFIPRLPASQTGPIKAPVPPVDTNKVKQTGEMLQNMMLRHQRPPGPRLSPVLAHSPVLAKASVPAQAPIPSPVFTPIRPLLKQRNVGEVIPLRKPLPPEGPMPLKPKRPPLVNLEPHRKFTKRQSALSPAPLGPRTGSVSPNTSRRVSLPAVINPPKLPQRDIKPGRLPRQAASIDLEETYDDVGVHDENDMQNDQEEDDEVYEYIDEDQVEVIRVNAEKNRIENIELKPNKKDMKKQQEQEKREQLERQKRESELKKNFQLHGEVEVLYTASVRHDWYGGSKLDLSVRQGESVEIIRVKNNPGGKWLARSLSGAYGYISNTCVDIDYEEIKRKALQYRKFDPNELPPPPPDPPAMFTNNNDSVLEDDDDDYDDVDPNPGSAWSSQDFPPPPIELNLDPRVEKELRKKFKFDGPLEVLHTMMVDPNAIIKKPGAKDLSVMQGEILDVIKLTNSKKALCRNQFGKFGFVNRALLLTMERDVYDDVDYSNDVYDNDSSHADFKYCHPEKTGH